MKWTQELKTAKSEKIYLPSVLKAFSEDHVICKNFISVVGDICNNGATLENIDVLLDCEEPKRTNSILGMATRLIIENNLKKIGINKERINFIYDNFFNNLTSQVNCYDLVLKLNQTKTLKEIKKLSLEKVSPFIFVTQPKPQHGRFEELSYSPETVLEIIQSKREWREHIHKGVVVEKKFNGIRCQVHKLGKNIIIWTDKKENITEKVPTLAAEIKKINHDFVAEAELELWIKNEHQNKEYLQQTLSEGMQENTEKNTIINFYDLLYLNGKDTHTEIFKERILKLKSIIPNSDRIKVSNGKIVKSLEELKAETIKVSRLPGSEGAILKKAEYIYPLTNRTSDIIKLKNEYSINVQVTEVNREAKTFSTAIKDGEILIPTGKAYITSQLVEIGDKLKISFVELSKYIDPKTKRIWFNLWSPKIIEKVGDIDTLEKATELVKKSGGQISEKKFSPRYKNLSEEEQKIYINDFISSSLLWDTEEFDFSLNNGWIKNSELIPNLLANNGSEIRNADNYILKKKIGDKAIICLRDKENKIETEKIVCLTGV